MIRKVLTLCLAGSLLCVQPTRPMNTNKTVALSVAFAAGFAYGVWHFWPESVTVSQPEVDLSQADMNAKTGTFKRIDRTITKKGPLTTVVTTTETTSIQQEMAQRSGLFNVSMKREKKTEENVLLFGSLLVPGTSTRRVTNTEDGYVEGTTLDGCTQFKRTTLAPFGVTV